jgi:hypothetical protein
VPANLRKLKTIHIPIGRIEKFKFYHHGLDDPIQVFWVCYEAELVLAPISTKILDVGSICFKGPNRANQSQFSRLRIVPGFA